MHRDTSLLSSFKYSDFSHRHNLFSSYQSVDSRTYLFPKCQLNSRIQQFRENDLNFFSGAFDAYLQAPRRLSPLRFRYRDWKRHPNVWRFCKSLRKDLMKKCDRLEPDPAVGFTNVVDCLRSFGSAMLDLKKKRKKQLTGRSVDSIRRRTLYSILYSFKSNDISVHTFVCICHLFSGTHEESGTLLGEKKVAVKLDEKRIVY